jgi:hypothetical protein
MRHDDATTDELVREVTAKYRATMMALRLVMRQLGELVDLKHRIEDAGASLPHDVDVALRKVEARLLKDVPTTGTLKESPTYQ